MIIAIGMKDYIEGRAVGVAGWIIDNQRTSSETAGFRRCFFEAYFFEMFFQE